MPSMNLLQIGHSYVHDLVKEIPLVFETAGHTIEVSGIYKSGGTYNDFLNIPNLWSRVEAQKADIIVVILAGNSITESVTNSQIYTSSRLFYRRLRNQFPAAKIVSAQVEPRFYKAGNKWGCPVGTEFHKRRVAINNFLRTLKIKDHILMVGGPNHLDNIDLYCRDGVHLTNEGILFYYNMIKKTIRFLSNQ